MAPAPWSAPEPAQLGSQRVDVAADVADHRDPRTSDRRGQSAGAGPASTRGSAVGRDVVHPPLHRGDLADGLGDDAAVDGRERVEAQDVGGRPAALELRELVAQPEPLQHLEDLDQRLGLRRRAASPSRPAARSRSAVGSSAEPALSAAQRAMLTIGSRACALMSNVSRRGRAGRGPNAAGRAWPATPVSSSRMVPRVGAQVAEDRGRPPAARGRRGSGRPSTSSEVIIAPWCSLGCRQPALGGGAPLGVRPREGPPVAGVAPWVVGSRPARAEQRRAPRRTPAR